MSVNTIQAVNLKYRSIESLSKPYSIVNADIRHLIFFWGWTEPSWAFCRKQRRWIMGQYMVLNSCYKKACGSNGPRFISHQMVQIFSTWYTAVPAVARISPDHNVEYKLIRNVLTPQNLKRSIVPVPWYSSKVILDCLTSSQGFRSWKRKPKSRKIFIMHAKQALEEANKKKKYVSMFPSSVDVNVI